MNHPRRNKIKNWPEYLRKYRDVNGFTQASLADRLMISKRVVENWEGGINTPPPYLKITLDAIRN